MGSFLDRIKQGVGQVKNEAQDKLHEAQLKGQLRAIEREKSDAILALGNALYVMHRAGEIQLDTLHSQFELLDAIEARLDEKQREIDEFTERFSGSSTADNPASDASNAVHRCSCGATLSTSARFCHECGKSVEPEAAV